MKESTSASFVISCLVAALIFVVASAYMKVRGLETQILKVQSENQVTRDAFLALTRTNWLFKDARLAASGYTVTVASHDDRNLEIKTLECTVPATALSPHLRNMDRYGEPRALKGKPVVFRLPQGPPYGNTLVFDGLLEFAIVQ